MRRHLPGEIDTFGFRCAGASFDESHYARSLAKELGTQHSEVEFGEAQSLDVLDAVRTMEVPFCDIGIEVGTWILARSAAAAWVTCSRAMAAMSCGRATPSTPRRSW
ncbi:MAG: asparagine synthase-related protein [Gammaproteobacteria bacterium]